MSPNICSELVDDFRILHSALACMNRYILWEEGTNRRSDVQALLRDNLIRFVLRCLNRIDELNALPRVSFERRQMVSNRMDVLEEIFGSTRNIAAFVVEPVEVCHGPVFFRFRNPRKIYPYPLIVLGGNVERPSAVNRFLASSERKLRECSGKRGLNLRKQATIRLSIMRHGWC